MGRFFVDRPIFAAVLSIVLTLIGTLAYFRLPVEQYPEIAPPSIVVRASYPGADAETVAATVATPLEQEINGVEDMLYMSSFSTADGSMALTVTFELGTDIDAAQVLVQNRVAIAEPRLPEEVRRLGVTTTKSSPNLMMVVHLLSPDDTFDPNANSPRASGSIPTASPPSASRRATSSAPCGNRTFRCRADRWARPRTILAPLSRSP